MQLSQTIFIDIDKVSVNYDDVVAINQLSLKIKKGEVVSLLGENGAGKSTLINTILGRCQVNTGSIKIFGEQPGSQAAKVRIGTILQDANLPDNVTVKEQLNLFRHYYPHARSLEDLLNIAMLKGIEEKRMNKLSGGQKQRVFFALAICGNPDIVFLDEPTVGLDTSARKEFWQCIENIKHQGASIILTTHYLEEAEALSDRILLLNQGNLIWQGTPTEIKNNMTGKKVSFHTSAPKQTIVAFFDSLGSSDVHTNDTNIEACDINIQAGKVECTSQTPEVLLARLFAQKVPLHNLLVEPSKFEDAVLAMNEQMSNKAVAKENVA
ncbi:ABC transporter ATP-binding protein [Agaribacter marinus]|uniref:ABC transporter ATP-binding protein n=1 Tax=Agaribacter marinus TaxID=1431249 RepID=A0AA37WI89_9ALTE|nr:ABC transporter ATP-binding protein [Agaribacter marinus]GLR70683.1 ABC transporter ATP-binding protein [Agaribacter marinus]